MENMKKTRFNMTKEEKTKQINKLRKRIELVENLLPIYFTGDLSQLKPLYHCQLLRSELYKLQATKTT